MNTKYNRASKSNVFKYAFGGIGSNIAFMAVMMYLTFFYTDIFGISAMATATLMLTSRLVDAITDPLMGMLADRTKSRFGKFRPYVIFGAPVLGLSMILLFMAPDVSPTMKLVYAYITYIFYSLASTVVNISYHALTPVMTNDPNQRTSIAILKQIMALPANMFVQALTLPIVAFFGNDANAWTIYGVISAVLLTGSFWVSAWGAKSADVSTATVEHTKAIPFSTQMNLIVKNKPLLMLLIASLTDLIAGAMAMGVNMYFFIYVLGRVDLVPLVGMMSILPPLLIMPFLPKLSEKFGKKNIYLAGTVLVIIPLFALLFVPATNIPLIMGLLLMNTLFSAIPMAMSWAMIPDCVEYGEWKTNMRGEGTVSSTLTFVNKFGMAIGGALVGLILGIVGYMPNQDQTPAVLQSITILKFGAPILGYICSLVSMSFYNINNDFFKKMTTEIAARKVD